MANSMNDVAMLNDTAVAALLNASAPIQRSLIAKLDAADVEIAMDAIAQVIPHLGMQDCLKVIELASAQASLIEVMGDRKQALTAMVDANVEASLEQAIAA